MWCITCFFGLHHLWRDPLVGTCLLLAYMSRVACLFWCILSPSQSLTISSTPPNCDTSPSTNIHVTVWVVLPTQHGCPSLAPISPFWCPWCCLIGPGTILYTPMPWSWASFSSLHLFLATARGGPQTFHCLMVVIAYCFLCLATYHYYLSSFFLISITVMLDLKLFALPLLWVDLICFPLYAISLHRSCSMHGT